MSDIGSLVDLLLAAGTPPALAARVVAEAFAAGAASAEFRGQNLDETAERRRAKDRDRKRLLRGIPQTSADNPRNSTTPLTLTSLTSSEPEIKKEKKVRARKPPASALSADFQPKQGHFDAAEKLGIPRQAVFEKFEDMRLWAQGNGILKVDWDATLHGFLRRDASKLSTNGNRNGPHQPKPGSVPDIARRYAEQFESETRDSFEGHSGTLLRLSQR